MAPELLHFCVISKQTEPEWYRNPRRHSLSRLFNGSIEIPYLSVPGLDTFMDLRMRGASSGLTILVQHTPPHFLELPLSTCLKKQIQAV